MSVFSQRTKRVGLGLGLLALMFLLVWFEFMTFSPSEEFLEDRSFQMLFLFFLSINFHLLLLFIFIYLSFRYIVKGIVEMRSGVFGSHLRVKLTTSFLFFALLPTLVLLFLSTRFVDENFEKWLPKNLLSASKESLQSEVDYQHSITQLLRLLPEDRLVPPAVDFSYINREDSSQFKSVSRKVEKNNLDDLESFIRKQKNLRVGEVKWLRWEGRDMLVAVYRVTGNKIVGRFSPPPIHSRWQVLKETYLEAKPAAAIFRSSYYILIGVVTILILFSATWLGSTIAREFTTPLQALAAATEKVARGNYQVFIDDFVSSDEIGRLALSFRSMVSDLKSSRESALEKAKELAEKSEYNEIILHNIQSVVIALSSEHRVEAWNEQAYRFFGKKEKEVLGQSLKEVVGAKFFNIALKPLLNEALSSDKRTVRQEYAGLFQDRDVQIQLTASHIVFSKGKRGTVIVIHDVTEVVKAQRLAAWRDVARRIAHEIKNPLTPVQLGAQRLQKKSQTLLADPERKVFKETLDVILNSADTIRTLVDAFVSLVRMPSPKLVENDIGKVISDAVLSLKENPENMDIITEVVFENSSWEEGKPPTLENLNVSVYIDEAHIQRLLLNLLVNAMNASEEVAKKVLVRTEVSYGRKKVFISVIDWGTGIPEDLRGKIFEPYFSTKRKGTGLGLAIAKQIAQDHRGQLSYRGNEPQGSCFTLELPIQMPNKPGSES